ncbi:amidohydrolase family protein [Jatrophihabitans cynanchi]|uniref:Amidohydrolase family protein n=1 Tax=Jatrophihabitans cynanchi TaxID=2944128 RepID=A0ABY7K4C3_9ACTN|nr:amidohydrolase family protein [Jatrophihabitans sp. SB3-54]WAX58397.1 amidohydrolase family protein [Jatrophihabitans sp. SB3-54]
MYDVVIRNGTVVDGTGSPSTTADIAVLDGVIAEVGVVAGSARTEIDATGLMVTPGFVDVHTHYDGQVSWDSLLAPSSLHGVTTVVMGNCGVGFAPVAPDRHDWLIGLMEGVEDIPGSVLSEGMTWGWESVAEYLDVIDTPHAIDFAVQIPHDAVRTYVMGERGADHESVATADELAEMRRIIVDGVRAGAIGWSTGRTPAHKTATGLPTPSMTAPPEELISLSAGLADVQAGVIDVMSDFLSEATEMELIRQISLTSRRPMSITMLQRDAEPDAWRTWLTQFAEISRESGSPIVGQVSVRAIGLMLGWDLTFHPFVGHPTYRALADLPLPERVAELRRPEIRSRILAEQTESDDAYLHRLIASMDRIYRLGDPPDYEPVADQSLAAIGQRAGVDPLAVAYDHMMEMDGQALLYFPTLNYFYGDLEDVREMLEHENTVPALGDGGAHCGAVVDASFPTTLLTHWGRDRVRGERLPVEWLIKRQTMDTARTVGLLDRGRIAPGYRADLNVIDFENLNAKHPYVAYDLPAGGRRVMQEATGYVATIVAGEVTFENGRHTGALPGRLVRGAQPAPAPELKSSENR